MKKFNKDKLLRIVKCPDGSVMIDHKGNADGRGAYLCKNLKCIEIAEKKKKLSRALRCEINEEILKSIAEGLNDGENI